MTKPNQTTALVPVASTPCTVFKTGIPGIGDIDFSNPFELAVWGGVAATAIFAKGWWRVILPVGLLYIRYQCKESSLFGKNEPGA